MGLDILIIGIFNGIPLVVLMIGAAFLWRKWNKKIHLSTAVILVALVGILLGENLTRHDGELLSRTIDRTPITVKKYSYGFPFPIDCIVCSESVADYNRLPYDVDWSYRKLPNGDVQLVDDLPLDLVLAVWNIEIGIALILLVAFTCEMWIQRREATKV
jgi:hypothetical protein